MVVSRNEVINQSDRKTVDNIELNGHLNALTKPPENLRDILLNVTNSSEVLYGKRLSYLNNFVKLLDSVSDDDKLGFTISEIVYCLRVALVDNSKELRAGCLRALRYLLRNSTTLQTMLDLQIDILVGRCLDFCQDNDVERIQSMRFIRRILTVAPQLFPQSLANVLVAIANDGDSERDRLQRACLATLCELAIKNTDVFAQAGGIATLIRNILDSQVDRINESVIMTIMHLLNYPHTRCHLRSSLDLEQILAPFTDLNYKHTGEASDQHQSEEREIMFRSSRLAIISMLRSWPGMIRLCKPESGGLHSLINILCIPNEETRKHIMTLIFHLFHLHVPDWTDDFFVAIITSDASHWQSSWSLSEGFVVEEAKVILPHLASSRTNLVENHNALLLSAFINAGLLESLVEVITSGSDHLATMATVLLGELLHLANRLLPPECSHHYHCLPTLMSIAAAFNIPPLQRNRANAAVNHLNTLHEVKKTGNVPRSLFLDNIMSHQRDLANERKSDKAAKEDLKQFLNKDLEEAIKNSNVLTDEAIKWNWDLLSTIFKWSSLVLSKSEDANVVKFLRNIAYFYRPQSNLFCRKPLDKIKVRSQELQQYTVVGIQFVHFLVCSIEPECQRILSELVEDIVDCIGEILLSPTNSVSGQAVFSPHSLHTTLSQDYMLFLGTLSGSLQGEKILEKHGAFQYFLDLCTLSHHDSLLRLIITCLDYKRDGLARVILTKMLSSSVDAVRLYTTSHLRVLLRARIPYFHNWGMELLVMQLYDKNKAIALESVDIIDEACEDEANLHSLVQIRPTVLHMGDRGAILLTRFLSTTTGFRYLSEVNFVNHELQKWFNSFNKRYVVLVETQMNEAFTSYIKPMYEGAFVRRSRDDRKNKDVFVPAHLYGQLVQHKGGADLIDEEDYLSQFCRTIHCPDMVTCDGVLTLKAALWAVGHIGSSNWGLKLLEREEIIPDIIRLAEECEVFSVRGTCFNVLGLLAKTKQGSGILSKLGWESIRHSRNEQWPVVEEQEGIFSEKELVESTSMSSFDSVSTRTNSPSPYQFDESIVNQEPESLFFVTGDNVAVSPKSTFFLSIDDKGEHKLATGAQKAPHLESSVRSKNKDKIGFPLYQAADTDGYSKCNSGIRREIAANQDRRIPRTNDLRRVKTMPSMEGNDDSLLKSPLQKIRSNSDSKARSRNVITNSHSQHSIQTKPRTLTDSAYPPPANTARDRSQSLKFRSNSNESSGRGSAGSKSRSESFTTDTTQTSGVSSMLSHPSSPHHDSSMTSLSTVMSGQTVKTVHSSDATRRQYNLHRTPSFTQRVSRTLPRSFGKNSGGTFETNAVFTSRRDANGYAALRALQLHRRLSVDDCGLINTFQDDHLTNSKFPLSRSSGSLTGFISNSMPCIPSPKANQRITSAVGGYMGLCLPVDVHLIFHDDESLYRQNFFKLVENCQSQQLQVTCVDNVRFTKHKNLSTSFPTLLPLSPQESSLPESYQSIGHVTRNSLQRDKYNSQQTDDDIHLRQFCFRCSKDDTDEENDYGRLRSVSECEPLDIKLDNLQVENSMEKGEFSMSPSSDVSNFSRLSSSKFTSYNSNHGYQLLRKELMQFISNMCSSVRRKAQEQGLLNLKEKFPHIFEDICLYSDVCHTLATHTFRLSARRFIQELFQEVKFDSIIDIPQAILADSNKVSNLE
ncbi:rapamycin-insensitive companion of mTOR-like isoform X2 [Antedon mediterranea]|uniref:rapamycin-insensitive companion of mTOR-like isoform X2 n=1 Tax=Antedon mediterranea TaxID=105859 RepID=UPI003AF8BA12